MSKRKLIMTTNGNMTIIKKIKGISNLEEICNLLHTDYVNRFWLGEDKLMFTDANTNIETHEVNSKATRIYMRYNEVEPLDRNVGILGSVYICPSTDFYLR